MTATVHIAEVIHADRRIPAEQRTMAPAKRGNSDLTAAVMREAWFCYRRQAGEGFPFSRKLFAAHLRSAWSVCRQVSHARATGGNGFLEPADPNWV